MMKTYQLIWMLLTVSERRQFVILIFATLLMSVFDVVGVAGILPFLSVLANPDLLDRNSILLRFADLLGLETHQEITVALGLAVFILTILSMAVRGFVTYLQIRFSLMRAYAISTRMLNGYISQSYMWHLARHTSDLGESLLSEVDFVVRESILPAVLLVSNICVVIFISVFVFIVEPSVALGAIGLLLTIYLLAFFGLRRRLDEVGRKRIAANKIRFRVLQEIAGGLKEMKVMGFETESLRRFRAPARELAYYQTVGLVIARLPRFALEAATYGGFVAMILVMIVVRGGSMANFVPLLGLLGVSASRLFPALQQMFQQLSAIRFSEPALIRLTQQVADMAPAQIDSGVSPLRLRNSLALSDLRFRYPSGEHNTLDGLSAVIPARTTLGIIGATGAGKTTLVDLILGLLKPDSGKILVDGEPLTSDRTRAWQKSIGYVPQHIYLADDTVAANIAFGIPTEKIEMAKVERAAHIANLHNFVMSGLPDGYLTTVGERGIRLSGGQRQRIGIARALYHDPDVLILDEATSALDNLTERAVMEAVHNLSNEKTVILIAHRLSTVKKCDTIFLLENGMLAAEGTFDELVITNEKFRLMVHSQM